MRDFSSVYWLTTIVFSEIVILALASISPKTAEAESNGDLRVACNYPGNSLDKCLFKVWLENEKGESPDTDVLDFSRGSDSPQSVRRRENNDINFKASYLGEGLDQGDCGVNFSNLIEGRYFVGCRARFQDGDWKYDFMTLFVNSQGRKIQDDNSSPYVNQTVEHMQASNAFIFTASENIQECQLFLPEQPPFTLTQDDREKSTNVYEGNLVSRKCSVKLLSITLRASGPIWALYKEVGDRNWKAFAPQIINVKAAPGQAKLIVDPIRNENVTATCSVPPGRPAARLRWTVDGNVSKRDDDHSLTDAWAWPWDSQPVEQKLTIKQGEYRSVECHVYYPDFNTEKEVLEEVIKSDDATTKGRVVPFTTTPPDPQTTASTDKPDVPGSNLLWLWIIPVVAAIVLGGLGYKYKEKIAGLIKRDDTTPNESRSVEIAGLVKPAEPNSLGLRNSD